MNCKFCLNKKIILFHIGRPRRKVGIFVKDFRKYIKCQNCFSIYQDLKNFNLKEHGEYFSSGAYSKSVCLKENSKTKNFQKDLASESFCENINYLSLFDYKSVYNKKILDYGCGAGNFLKFLYLFSENKSANRVGIDPIYKFLKVKKNKKNMEEGGWGVSNLLKILR
jgi:SAM-dependent methyltransferase